MKSVVVMINLKRLIYLVSFVSLILMIMEIHPYVFLPIAIGSFLVGLFIAIFFTQRLGTPSNVINSEQILDQSRIDKVIKVVEQEKGIWQIQDNKYNTLLDMKNWLRRKKYIADMIITIFVLDSYNKSSQSAFSLPYGNQKFRDSSLEISFTNKNNKEKRKIIVRNYIIKKGLQNRIKYRFCLKGVKGSSRKYSNTKHYEITMKDIYIFKK